MVSAGGSIARIRLCTMCLALAACGPRDDQPTVPAPVPDERLVETPSPAPLPALPAPVKEKRATLRAAAERGSITRLARIARKEPAFLSNFGDMSHYDHWMLLRRIGVDPNAGLLELFEMPYATKRVGDETWYIWPDLAARPSEALVPERLDFAERARLKDMVGASGLDAIRAGESYPGRRTAISETGAWRYFLHEGSQEGDE